MSTHVATCRPDHPVRTVAEWMARHKIRRIPVVDDDRHPIGIVSLNDLALASARSSDIPRSKITRPVTAWSDLPHRARRYRHTCPWRPGTNAAANSATTANRMMTAAKLASAIIDPMARVTRPTPITGTAFPAKPTM
jgi:CBS-domain-containing membrane protein